jgi:hypothetical protein
VTGVSKSRQINQPSGESPNNGNHGGDLSNRSRRGRQ